jgi:anti-anti-sigma factor
MTRSTATELFVIEQEGDTLIVSSVSNLRELDCEWIEEEAARVLEVLSGSPVNHVVLDLRKTDYCGTTALGAFISLWQAAQERGGRLALCNFSEHARMRLSVTNLDRLWPLCPSRVEALRAVRAHTTGGADFSRPGAELQCVT